jgi:hypothetical protein
VGAKRDGDGGGGGVLGGGFLFGKGRPLTNGAINRFHKQIY